MTDAPKHPSHLDPANELASDSSPIDPRDFRNALGTYATGVTIITAVAADGKPYGLTCNSFASVSLNPPLVLWSLGMFSQGVSIFQNASHFAVNVLGASPQALATKFAKSSEDKFAGVEWTPGLGNAPILADSVATFQCRAANRYYGGYHIIFLGAVEAYAYNRREPLLFARGGYGRFLPPDDVTATPKSESGTHSPNVLAPSRSGCRRMIAARSSLPRRLNFSPTRDLGEGRAIWRVGSASPSRCCIVTFQARTT